MNASQSFKKREVPRRIGRVNGGLNSKLKTVRDKDEKSIRLLLLEEAMRDYKGATLLLSVLPDTQKLIVYKDYDVDWFRQELSDKNIKSCISSRTGRSKTFCSAKVINCVIKLKTYF